ncbi:MAG TPA: glycerate kinase [Microbacterium sp.]|uniref:glycerate kinase n=1 Tax=Microbacterium sp. TaxID=51671 RepID=UPI002BA6CA14|nr:glycerate kinase [Microbacterium sp.]HWI30444.1 glycerate kinase [Microbacterium sp.]
MSRTIVVAPDSFKGTITASDAAAAVAAGWRDARPDDDIRLLPMADGGEGTLEAFATAVPGAERVPVRVIGPDDREVDTFWLRLPPTPDAPDGTAIVELGATSGIELLSELRPLAAHTYGLGQAIAAALAAGVSRVVVGLGSSASTDGGTGMLRALGAQVRDDLGADVPLGGAGLSAAASVSALPPLPAGGVRALTDVTNPLLGRRGAAAVFGPQKGATPDDVAALDGALAHLATLLPDADPATPGAGAAGGTGFGLLAWGAILEPGSVAVAELIGLPAAAVAASVVITGEGSFDGQSAAGKVPAYVAEAAGPTPVALVAGRIAADADTSAFAASLSLTDLAGSPEAAMADPATWLWEAGRRFARELG